MTTKIAGKGSGGRPATGSIVWADPETKTEPVGVRVTKADGKRALVRFEPGTTREDALALAPVLAERGRSAVDEGSGLTVAEYAERWCAWRESRGLGCVADDRAVLARHALPAIGLLEVRSVTRDDLKRLVSLLDAKAKRGFTEAADGTRKSFGWKSAVNAWSVVRALFRDACGAKRVDLCVRDDNPAAGVVGPDLGPRKAKAYLWPSEFDALMSCDRVPVRWRRLFALAVYTYARAGELAALEWSDVDFEHGTIHVHRSRDRATERASAKRKEGAHGARATKATKTESARRFPIEPALVPLLKALHAESNGRGLVFPWGKIGSNESVTLRDYLKRAGVTRADLFASDETRKAITFHDLRATGITWCAMRGDDPLKIMQRAGHSGFETTRIYLREAENLSQSFGVVFPPLPAELLRKPASARGVSASVSAFGVAAFATKRQNKQIFAERAGFEPAVEF